LFTLTLKEECEDSTLQSDNGNPGIADFGCEVSGPGSNLEPETITKIEVFELNSANVPVNQEIVLSTSDPALQNGGLFFYTSFNDQTQPVPSSIQVILTGVNSANETVVNTIIITYTNDCGSYPIFPPRFPDDHNQLGWVTIVSVHYALLDRTRKL
jgi:hypothetical protein